jgi:hypothetical protein
MWARTSTMAMRSVGLRQSVILPLQRRCASSDSSLSSSSSSLFGWYAKKLDSHPLLTKGITSGIISGTGDVICQFLSNPDGGGGLDFLRTGRFFLMGAFWVAPVTHLWYGALSTRLLPGKRTVWKVGQRLAVDQFAFSPIFLPSFMGILWTLEGRTNIPNQLVEVLPELLVASWSLWIPAMSINFGFVPLKYQVLFGNVAALMWTVYLSYKNAASKERQEITNTDQ